MSNTQSDNITLNTEEKVRLLKQCIYEGSELEPGNFAAKSNEAQITSLVGQFTADDATHLLIPTQSTTDIDELSPLEVALHQGHKFAIAAIRNKIDELVTSNATFRDSASDALDKLRDRVTSRSSDTLQCTDPAFHETALSSPPDELRKELATLKKNIASSVDIKSNQTIRSIDRAQVSTTIAQLTANELFWTEQSNESGVDKRSPLQVAIEVGNEKAALEILDHDGVTGKHLLRTIGGHNSFETAVRLRQNNVVAKMQEIFTHRPAHETIRHGDELLISGSTQMNAALNVNSTSQQLH